MVPAYTHPPWEDPVAEFSGRVIFHTPAQPVSADTRKAYTNSARTLSSHPDHLFVYTDGSRMDRDNTPATGAASLAMFRGQPIAHRLIPAARSATVSDAEILALTSAPMWAFRNFDILACTHAKIHFLSDSLVALNLCKTWPSSPGAHLLPHWRNGIRQLLDSNRRLTVHFHWCPGHAGIDGNERVDALAKEATRLPPATTPPSLSALKEMATKTLVARWTQSVQQRCPSRRDPGLAINGPPTLRVHKLLRLHLSRSALATTAQVLCNAGPFGGYFVNMSAEYRRSQAILLHCRWHNGPPWPLQDVEHILGGCTFQAHTIRPIWPKDVPLPTHHREWTSELVLPTLAKWLFVTKPIRTTSTRIQAAVRLALERMELDGLDTGEDIDIGALRHYTTRELDPRGTMLDPLEDSF